MSVTGYTWDQGTWTRGGALVHKVTHPLQKTDPLFLSFDPNHSIKNLRSNFLEREMIEGEQPIQGGLYSKKLSPL